MTILSAEVDGWPTVYRAVLSRDRACIFAPASQLPAWMLDERRVGIPGHVCRGRNGREIDWGRTTAARGATYGDVELDHVKEQPAIGAPIVKRKDRHSYKAPDDEAHLVTACYYAHHGGLATSHRGREYEREWLAARYPQVWATTTEGRSG